MGRAVRGDDRAGATPASRGLASGRLGRVTLIVSACTLALVALRPGVADAQWGVGIDRIDVSLSTQHAFVWGTDGTLLRDIPISSGANGRTPRGNFRVSRRSASTVSTHDRNVAMSWMVNFNGYIGFHGIPRRFGEPMWTPLGERPVSSGCVRMADADARWIFDNAPNGTRVNVK